MNQSNSFIRKVAYIATMGFLLIPLSMVSRPETRDASNAIKDPGGKLSRLRDKHELSQARMMEIDPASETMKLASLGLRGVAVNMLWMQAIEAKKTENWDQMAATLNALIKIQPNFVRVWEYQAHNLSYNISVEFDDYEYRYHWVKKGIIFLTEGIPYNYRDHRMTDNLGFFTGMKIGRSDEKFQFRRLFREDVEFREQISPWIDSDSYFVRGYGHDNWGMAWQWYDRSLQLVERESAPQYKGDMLFYMFRPAQRRNEARALQEEFRTDEIMQELWRRAYDEWLEYGNREISNTRGVVVTMEGIVERERRIERLRAQLDELAPGIRDELIAQIRAQAQLTPEMEAALKIPADQRTDEEADLARRANAQIFRQDNLIDVKVALQVKPEDQVEARRLLDQIMDVLNELRTTTEYARDVNYAYWKERTLVESLDETAAARAALYDASEMKRESIFDDEYEIDPETGEKKIVKIGAITKYERAFVQWREILDNHKSMYEGELADDLINAMKDYYQMLKVTGREWPADHPLQNLIDYRSQTGEYNDDLPTSEEIEERESLKRDDLGISESNNPADSETESADDKGNTPSDESSDDAEPDDQDGKENSDSDDRTSID